MRRPYKILYFGKLAERHLTAKGALKAALLLAKDKGWKLEDLKIEMEMPNE